MNVPKQNKDKENAIVTCPYCGSTDTRREKLNKRAYFFTFLLLGFPLVFREKRYECLNCEKKWKE